ncbi:MAG: sugar phosphate isomerase/epimerase [Nitriliruptorales bacterium]|nr:sugar phosphate isomerase/epimerase [Nitriliruptorales bacterium]
MATPPMAPWCASHNDNPPDMRQLVTRRGFLRAGLTVTASGAVLGLGAGAAAAEECADGVGSIPVEQRNIQLFTLLAAHLAAPAATLSTLYQIGYRNVEHIGVYVPDAQTFRTFMDNAGPDGIQAPTGHTGISHPFDHDQVMGLIEDAHVIGHQWLINPSANFDDEAGWAEFGDTINKAGELAVANGLQGAGHHNHAQEYTPFTEGGDRRPTDVLMEVCDPAVTRQEMDLCWVWSSGTDPVEYLEKYPDRYGWFHVKDMNEAGQPTYPGLGLIDFNRIFEAAAATQTIEQYIIEQDAAPTGFESAQLGWDLLENAEFACPTGAVDDDTTEPTPPGTSDGDGEPMPATGGGLVALGLAAIASGVVALRNRQQSGGDQA